MLIDFTAIEEQICANMRGGEKEAGIKSFQDESNKIMRGRLVPGGSIGLHTHEKNSETVYILSGTGKFLYDGEYEPLAPGSCHYCPKGHAHSLINDSEEDLVFFALVPEHETK